LINIYSNVYLYVLARQLPKKNKNGYSHVRISKKDNDIILHVVECTTVNILYYRQRVRSVKTDLLLTFVCIVYITSVVYINHLLVLIFSGIFVVDLMSCSMVFLLDFI